MFKKFFFIFCILNNAFFSWGQSVEIVGTVYSNNNQPIPFANLIIEGQRNGTVSNELGDFSIVISKSDLNSTLVISAIGFETEKAKLSEDSIKIKLNKKTYNLNPIEVLPGKRKMIEVGAIAFLEKEEIVGSSVTIRIPTGFQRAIFLDNTNNSSGLFKSVSYYIKHPGKHKTPFRVKIYSKNEENNAPDSLLIKEDIIVKAKKKNGWVKVDLSAYNIVFPAEGAFVSMEWITDKKKYRYKKKIKKNKKKVKLRCYGQSLGLYPLTAKMDNWSFYHGMGWVNENLEQKILIKSEIYIYE